MKNKDKVIVNFSGKVSKYRKFIETRTITVTGKMVEGVTEKEQKGKGAKIVTFHKSKSIDKA